MKRVLLATILVCGCGSKKDREQPQAAKTPDAAAGDTPTPTADARTRVDTLMAPSGDVPPAAVIIDADGSLRVSRTGSWAMVTAHGWRTADTVRPATLETLTGLVLEVIAEADDAELAQVAKEMKVELEQTPAEPEAPADPEDVAFTYLTPIDDELSPTTPLVAVDPAAPGRRVAEVLDKVGGVIGIFTPDGLRILRLAAPWDHLQYGGVDIDDERPSYDVELGRGLHRLSAEWQEGSGGGSGVPTGEVPIVGEVAALSAPPGGKATVDVMVTEAATAQDIVDAIAGFDASGAGTVGVGLSPWPW